MSNASDSKLPPVESGTNYYKLTTKGLAYRADLRAQFLERQIKRIWILLIVHSVAIAFIGFCLLATQLFPREPAKPQPPQKILPAADCLFGVGCCGFVQGGGKNTKGELTGDVFGFFPDRFHAGVVKKVMTAPCEPGDEPP